MLEKTKQAVWWFSYPYDLILGWLVTVSLGSWMHFWYKQSHESGVVSLFAPVDESVFQHLKLVHMPLMLWAWVRWTVSDDIGYWGTFGMGSLCACAVIVIIYYLWLWTVGYDSLPVDLISYGLSMALAHYIGVEVWDVKKVGEIRGVVLVTIITWLFMYWTWYPPNLELFRDPVNGNYGVSWFKW